MRYTGRIYYSDKYVIIQRDGDATATVSEVSWNEKGMVLTALEKWLSWDDALMDLDRREHADEAALARPFWADHRD